MKKSITIFLIMICLTFSGCFLDWIEDPTGEKHEKEKRDCEIGNIILYNIQKSIFQDKCAGLPEDDECWQRWEGSKGVILLNYFTCPDVVM